jgi:hypothetical protein
MKNYRVKESIKLTVPPSTSPSANSSSSAGAAAFLVARSFLIFWPSWQPVSPDQPQTSPPCDGYVYPFEEIHLCLLFLGAHPPPLAHFLIAPDFVGTGVPPCIHKTASWKCQLPVLLSLVWRDHLFNRSRRDKVNALGPGHVTAAVPNSSRIPIPIHLGSLCRLWA